MKKILSFILASFMLVTMAISLVACGGDGVNEQPKDDKKVYTVTVVDENGTPVEGVKITFSPKGAMDMVMTTNAEGKAKSAKTDKEVSAQVTEYPDEYDYDNKEIGFDENGNATVTLTHKPPYIVKVVDQDGNPVAGVSVQMCSNKGCVPFPTATDANGVTSCPYMSGEFQAQIKNLPEGYTADTTEYHDFEDNEVTIEVNKVN